VNRSGFFVYAVFYILSAPGPGCGWRRWPAGCRAGW